MNVVHLYDGHERVYDGRGSVPDVVWSLATRTAGRGHEVTVIERKWAGLPTGAEHGDVAFSRLDLRTGADEPWENIPYNMIGSIPGTVRLLLDRVNFARRAYSRLRSLNYDVVHVHLPFAANVLVTVAPWLRDRMVYTAHLGETESRVEEPTVSPDVYLAKRTARTIALNPKIRRAFADRGVSRDRLAVVPNGVDVSRFTDIDTEAVASVREAYDITGDPVVLFVGTLTPRKGVTELVEAAARVLSRHGGPELLLVGRTDLEPQYVERVRETLTTEEVADRVTLTGFVSEEELLACYELADLFVLPSSEEGSSVAVTEAMAAGLPVVGSRIDGIRQQVDHGTHGLLVDPGDVTGLAESISRLVSNDRARHDMADAIESRARSLSWERVTDRMLDVYAEVAGCGT